MFSVTLSPGISGSTGLEKIIAAALTSKSVSDANKSKAFVDKAMRGAVRITAARLRKRMIEAYKDNSLGWPKHREHSNWLGIGQSITVAHLARANRPIKTTTRSGKAKKSGYSQRPIKMPQPYQLGGRLPKALRYATEPDNLTVGILPNAKQLQKTKMQLFQDGRSAPISESSRRYLAALGIFVRRSTTLNSPRRLLIDGIQNKYPPEKLFENAFIDIITDKLGVRD